MRMNTLRRRWEMKQFVAKHAKDSMAQENRYAVLALPLQHLFALLFIVDWLTIQADVMKTHTQSAASEFVVIFLVECFVLAAVLCVRLFTREPFLLMQHQMTDLRLHTCLIFAVIFFMLAPMGSLMVRLGQAGDMMAAPRVVDGSSPAQCQRAREHGLDQRPGEGQIAAASEWTVRPWAEDRTGPTQRANSSAGGLMPLCTLTGNTTAAWVAWLLSSQSHGEQCWDVFTASSRYVLLYPPASVVEGCAGVEPLAVPFDSKHTEWARTLADGKWTEQAPKQSLTTLRTAIDRPWFHTPWAHDEGRVWFNASDAWLRDRIPLVMPYAIESPEQLWSQWANQLNIALGVVVVWFLIITVASVVSLNPATRRNVRRAVRRFCILHRRPPCRSIHWVWSRVLFSMGRGIMSDAF
jgi:hypothetical protein